MAHGSIPTTEAFAVSADRLVFEFLHEPGGSRAMNVNGAVTPVVFSHVATTDEQIGSIHVHMSDGVIQADGFGGLSALANGVIISVLNEDGEEIADFGTAMHPMQQNVDFSAIGGTRYVRDATGGGNDIIIIDIQFNESGAELLLRKGETILWTVRDNLTGLVEFTTVLLGFRH